MVIKVHYKKKLFLNLEKRIYGPCEDSAMKNQHKQVDPALTLCTIIGNDDISKERANGTSCQVIHVKRKSEET